MKKWIILLISPLLIYGAARFCHRETAGFRLAKVHDNFFLSQEDPLPLTLSSQTFTYFGRGLQSFSFLSEDGTTILKLFNNRQKNKPEKQRRAAQSYRLAFDELREETQLLYLHLAPSTHLRQKVTLIDKLHIAHTIDLNHHAFALQRRGTLAYPYITALMNAGKEQEAQEAVRSLLALIIHRCKLSIHDNDPLIRTNLGFLNVKPFYIDIGSFSKLSSPNPNYREEVRTIAHSLHRYLDAHHPSLATRFETLLEEELAK